jgi:hypothetical protein
MNNYYPQSRFAAIFYLQVWNPSNSTQFLYHSNINRKFDIILFGNSNSFTLIPDSSSQGSEGIMNYPPGLTNITGYYDIWTNDYRLTTFPDGNYSITLINSLDFLNNNIKYVNTTLSANHDKFSLNYFNLPSYWGHQILLTNPYLLDSNNISNSINNPIGFNSIEANFSLILGLSLTLCNLLIFFLQIAKRKKFLHKKRIFLTNKVKRSDSNVHNLSEDSLLLLEQIINENKKM